MENSRPAEAPFTSERRRGSRAVVDCPAQLELASGARPVRLVDLSQTGAQVRVESPPSQGASARLKWQAHEFYCTVMWVKGDLCGLQFDRPIEREVVDETVEYIEVELGPVAEINNIPLGGKRSTPDIHGLRLSRENLVAPAQKRRGFFLIKRK